MKKQSAIFFICIIASYFVSSSLFSFYHTNRASEQHADFNNATDCYLLQYEEAGLEDASGNGPEGAVPEALHVGGIQVHFMNGGYADLHSGKYISLRPIYISIHSLLI